MLEIFASDYGVPTCACTNALLLEPELQTEVKTNLRLSKQKRRSTSCYMIKERKGLQTFLEIRGKKDERQDILFRNDLQTDVWKRERTLFIIFPSAPHFYRVGINDEYSSSFTVVVQGNPFPELPSNPGRWVILFPISSPLIVPTNKQFPPAEESIAEEVFIFFCWHFGDFYSLVSIIQKYSG